MKKGTQHTMQTRKKMKEKKLFFWTPEMRKRVSLKLTGRKFTDSHRENIKISKTGSRHPFWGRKFSIEHKERLSISHKGLFLREKHPNWIYDRTKIVPTQERNDYAYKEWRRNVCNRDNWKCRIGDERCKGKVIVHHILSWARFPELRYQLNNGITLCQAHHPLKREEEAKLSPFFQELVAKIN